MARIVALASVLGVCIALLIGVIAVKMGRDNQCSGNAIAGGGATIGGPFELTDHNGNRVTSEDLITGPTLVYFGYTFCPDVCPLDVARNVAAVDILAEDGTKITPVFITIDPARDTVSELSDYAEVTHPDMVALTGSKEDVAKAAKAYRVYYRRASQDEDYLMDHSAFSYLMGPEGFLDYIRREMSPEEAAAQIACHL